jgi:hypothetical protein
MRKPQMSTPRLVLEQAYWDRRFTFKKKKVTATIMTTTRWNMKKRHVEIGAELFKWPNTPFKRWTENNSPKSVIDIDMGYIAGELNLNLFYRICATKTECSTILKAAKGEAMAFRRFAYAVLCRMLQEGIDKGLWASSEPLYLTPLSNTGADDETENQKGLVKMYEKMGFTSHGTATGEFAIWNEMRSDVKTVLAICAKKL